MPEQPVYWAGSGVAVRTASRARLRRRIWIDDGSQNARSPGRVPAKARIQPVLRPAGDLRQQRAGDRLQYDRCCREYGVGDYHRPGDVSDQSWRRRCGAPSHENAMPLPVPSSTVAPITIQPAADPIAVTSMSAVVLINNTSASAAAGWA